jgi:TldD protein
MYKFPVNLYTDVRIEKVSSTEIGIKNGRLVRNKTKIDTGAIIRIYDGMKWYYSVTTDINKIQLAIDELGKMATPNEAIYECPEIKILEVNKDKIIRYESDEVYKIDNKLKLELAYKMNALANVSRKIKFVWAFYSDGKVVKHFMSSKGTDTLYDKQNVRTGVFYTIVENDIPTDGYKRLEGNYFSEVINHEKEVEDEIRKDIEYAEKAIPVIGGEYPCVLAPSVAGVFAHESFGHKSEADFMMNDESMRNEWTIGKKVGVDNLSIIDSGENEYCGYTPYDDEGCKTKTTYLIKNGVLSGRLHNSVTAACLGEELTGNARALNFEYEPIVRMTNTYIACGTMSKNELFEDIKEGLFLDTWRHGSGMSIFTIAPARAYMIRDGQIAEPVRVSVVSGKVMDTLHQIDGISSEMEMSSGGCGKNEQHGLPVGQGGPFIRVRKLLVQ